MSVEVYSGRLTDIGAGVLDPYLPRLTVRPEREATAPDSLVVSERRVPVDVDPATGWFQMSLVPSSQLSPPTRYILELALFDESMDGVIFTGVDQWIFTAADGGGDVSDMGSNPPTALYVGPPWPAIPRPGAYFDRETQDLGYYRVEVS